MKKTFMLMAMMTAVLLSGIVFLASCSSDDEESNNLVGGWEGESKTADGYNAKFIFNFYDDGTYNMKVTTKSQNDPRIVTCHGAGSYSSNGSSITMYETKGRLEVPSYRGTFSDFAYFEPYVMKSPMSFSKGHLVFSVINFSHYYFLNESDDHASGAKENYVLNLTFTRFW